GGGSQELHEGLGFGNNLSILLLLPDQPGQNLESFEYSLFLPFVFCLFSFLCFSSLFTLLVSLPCPSYGWPLSSSSSSPSIKLICFTCLPIKRQQSPKSPYQFLKWFEILVTPLKVLLSMTLGCDLELPFNEPYLATSLQGFWGRRWNLMVPSILLPVIFVLVGRITERTMNSDQALFLGVLIVTFIVSGAVHELLFFYFTRDRPTWEVTWFFVLHGVCTAAERAGKRTSLGRQ
ncbi:unnamed protein product, partial [Brassica napus]